MLMAAVFMAEASEPEGRLSFAYDAGFEMNFDNREYYRSSFSRSMTIFAGRLTPSVGFSFTQDESTGHRLMVGADIMKDFGAPDAELLNEIVFHYTLDKHIGKTDLRLSAGILPRSRMFDNYSEAFISDSLAFYDNNIEGLLIQVRRPSAEFELGCDWLGQYGRDSRERFMIFSSGEARFSSVVSLGYAAVMYHFADSHTQKGVVDNILLNPWVKFDLAHRADMQDLSIKAGYLQGLQRDRAKYEFFEYPCGLEVDVEARKWDFGVQNRLFYGTDMMPYYNSADNTGEKYGTRLYFGDPFYRIHDDGSTGAGVYDRLQLFYEPSFGKWLKIRVAAMFHFHGSGYSGCSQQVVLKFNLSDINKEPVRK